MKKKDKTANKRTRRREAELLERLKAAGWKSSSQLLTAIKNGLVDPPRRPEEVK